MNAKSLFVVLLLAAIAAAAWFGLRGGDDAAPAPVPTPAAGANAQQPAAPVQADVATGGVGRTDLVQPGAERTAAPVAEKGAAAAATADQVTIRGRLVDAAKAPRAGVKLDLATYRSIEGIEIDMPMPDGGRRAAAKASTTSRADGSFEFPLATNHEGFLELTDDDLVFATDPRNIRASKGNQDLGDLVVVGCARLGGVVQDERGQPVADVKVSASLDGLGFGTMSTSKTDAAGKFTVGKLQPGQWTLRTASGKFLPSSEDFLLQAAQQRTDLVLVVKQGQAIAGQVLDDLGMPVAGAKVGSKRKEVRGTVDIERFTADEAATTDAHGYFTLAGLSGETATVRAFGGGCTAAVAQDVPVGTGNLVLRVERLAVIEGVLQGADGTPIAASTVRAVPDTGGAGLQGPREEFSIFDDLPMAEGRRGVQTAADGTFRLEGVKPGTVAVLAEGKTHRPVRQGGVAVQPAQLVKGVRLVADLGATARVSVKDEQGQPVAGAEVRAGKPKERGAPGRGGFVMRSRHVEADSESGSVVIGDDGEPFGRAVTDAAGLAVLTGLPAGPAEFTATHSEFAAAVPALLTLPTAGAIEAALAVRRPGFVEVRVLGVDGDPGVGSKFRVQPADGSDGTKNGLTDGKGVARVGPLAPGEYTAALVRAAGGTRVGNAMLVMGDGEGGAIGGSEQRCTVVAGETVVVELRRPQLTKVFGTVAGVDGPAVGCSIDIERAGGDDPMVGIPGAGGSRSVTAGADGSYEIGDVEPGEYVLRYGKPEQVVKAKLPIRVQGERELRQDLALRTGKLRVQAWSKVENAPIVGADVEVQEAAAANEGAAPRRQTRMMMVSIATTDNDSGESTMMTMGGQRARTGADGWAEIDDVPMGTYDLAIKHDKHVPADKKGQVVVERQTTDCGKVEMGQAGRIRGKVVTAEGKPARMAMVMSRLVGGEANSEPQPAMGGNIKIDALPPGRYLLKAQALVMGGGGPAPFGPEVEVEVKAGETTTCELKLPAK